MNPPNEVDETGAYYTEWSKPERKTPIQYTLMKLLFLRTLKSYHKKNVWIYADIRGYNVVQILFQLSEIRIHKNYIRMPIKIRW